MIRSCLLLYVALSFLFGCQGFLQTSSTFSSHKRLVSIQTRRSLFAKHAAPAGSPVPGGPGGLGDLMKQVMGGQRGGMPGMGGGMPGMGGGMPGMGGGMPGMGGGMPGMGGGMPGMGGGMPGMGGGAGGFDIQAELQKIQRLSDEYKLSIARLGQQEICGADSTGGALATFSGLAVPLRVKIDETLAKKSAEEISNAVTEALRNGHQVASIGIENAMPPEMRQALKDQMGGMAPPAGGPTTGYNPGGLKFPF
jgi:DNA-binding protein YbaB